MELVHAKMSRGLLADRTTAYQVDFVFGSPIKDAAGHSIGNAKPAHMAFMNGMDPEAFVIGLKALAEHIEQEFNLLPNEGELTEDG